MQHTWKIYDLKRVIADGMVTEATYACESQFNSTGTRTINNIVFTTGSSDDSDFILYDDLTENIVLGWVTGSVNTSSIETANSASIAESINLQAAITESTGTPW